MRLRPKINIMGMILVVHEKECSLYRQFEFGSSGFLNIRIQPLKLETRQCLIAIFIDHTQHGALQKTGDEVGTGRPTK